MKNLLLLLLLLPAICMAQKDPVTYTGVKETKGTKEELLTRAQRWINKQCSDVKTVSSDELVGNSSVMYNSRVFYGSMGTKGHIKYKVAVIVKDGKYKYELTQFTHEGNANNEVNLTFGLITEDEECPYHLKGQRKGWENKIWKELKENIEKESQSVIASLAKDMSGDRTDF